MSSNIQIKRCKVCGFIGRCYAEAISHCEENSLEVLPVTAAAFCSWCKVADDNDFFNAMLALKKKDIIEYNLKLSQFKAQTAWQNQAVNRSSSTLRCPQCGSANVSTGARGYSMLTGFAGAGKTVNRCGRCGYKWKPHGNYT